MFVKLPEKGKVKTRLIKAIGADAVIGPAYDGGYYLIGFRHDSFLPEVFKGISWGTDTLKHVRGLKRFL